MTASSEPVKIVTVASCSNLRGEHRGHVAVSGSYGGRYNAYNAAKWPVRAVIMNDAGIGKDNAGIVGLEFLDRIKMAAGTADAQTCHIGDGDHMLAHGIISHVNETAAGLGCKPGQTVGDCAELMRAAVPPSEMPPAISDGARYILRANPGEPRLVCADSIGMIEPEDAGQIVVTASHGALSGGRPDNAVAPDVYAVFFSDGGVGTAPGSPASRRSTRAAFPPGRFPPTARRSAIRARSTATASFLTSTGRPPGSAPARACRSGNSSRS
jgi:hypothetical protein